MVEVYVVHNDYISTLLVGALVWGTILSWSGRKS